MFCKNPEFTLSHPNPRTYHDLLPMCKAHHEQVKRSVFVQGIEDIIVKLPGLFSPDVRAMNRKLEAFRLKGLRQRLLDLGYDMRVEGYCIGTKRSNKKDKKRIILQKSGENLAHLFFDVARGTIQERQNAKPLDFYVFLNILPAWLSTTIDAR